MLDEHAVFEIHRLRDEGLSARRIADRLGLSRAVVRKYLQNPVLVRKEGKKQPSKLDPYRGKIKDLLEQDPLVSAVVIKQHLDKLDYKGSYTILKDYLRGIRETRRQAYIRFETGAGKQCQVDWGYFGCLTYGTDGKTTNRKLYCFAMVEGHSRMLYLEFTHSVKMEAFLRCHWNAFQFFGGSPREVVHDNLKTAVIERVGKLIRFNGQYLDFLRRFHVVPKACNVYAAWEKGKVEKNIHYIRQNFWPCRSFEDLADVNRQAHEWRDTVANVRIHGTTGERPTQRYRPKKMRRLPAGLDLDIRDTAFPTVQRDMRIKFDSNLYTVPPSMVGKDVTVRADNERVSIYYKRKLIASHDRSWERKKDVENPRHTEGILRTRRKALLSKQEQVFLSMGEKAQKFLEGLARGGKSLERSIERLLDLKREYGRQALLKALDTACRYGAFGMDYVENILHQQTKPTRNHPRVVLKDEELNKLCLDDVNLTEYDSMILKERKKDNEDETD